MLTQILSVEDKLFDFNSLSISKYKLQNLYVV